MMKTTGTTQNRAPSAPREAHQQAEFGDLTITIMMPEED